MADGLAPEKIETMLSELERSEEKQGPLTRHLPIESSRVIDEAKRTVEVSFSSEEPVNRWFGPEILDHSAEAVDLTRLNELGVVCWSHDQWSLPLGSVVRAWLDPTEKKGKATLRFDSDEEADAVFQKILSGTVRAVSVGYRVNNWEEVPAGETSLDGKYVGPCSIARKWTPYEISPVSIPADPKVGVGRSDAPPFATPKPDAASSRSDNTTRRNGPMTLEELRAAIAAESDAAKRAGLEAELKVREADVQRATEAEAQRINEINALCREANERGANLDAAAFVKDKATVAAVKEAALRALLAPTPSASAGAPQSNTRVTADEMDKLRAAVTDGIMLRAGLKVEKPAEGATAFQGTRLLRVAQEFLEREGKSVRRLTDDEMVREAFTPSSSFANVLSNVANLSVAQGYAGAPLSFEAWAGEGSLPDFKTNTDVRFSEAPSLTKLGPTGEYKMGHFSDSAETVRLETYGEMVAIKRQDIINDAFGVFTTIPMRLAEASKRDINAAVYQLLTSNTYTMADGQALFYAATHFNYVASGAAMSVSSIGDGIVAMGKQKDIGGVRSLNIAPQFVLVPLALMLDAKQLLASTSDPAATNSGVSNPLQNGLTVVADPALDAVDDGLAWYLAAPKSQASIVVYYLNGVKAPYLDQTAPFNVDGVVYRVRHDWVVAAMDYRGIYKNNGH